MRSLPSRPSLKFLSREAKRLKSRHRNGDNAVCRSVGHFDISLHGFTDQQILDTRVSILDAQRVVARQYGFASWSRLVKFIELSEAGQRSPADPSLRNMLKKLIET